MANRPIVHGRDHEHGGTDVVGIQWEMLGEDGGSTGDGVNDATIDATWTYLGGIFGLDTVIPGTLTDGTTTGFWSTNGTGTDMFCGLEGTWQIDITGTVTHSSTTAPTSVRFNNNSGTVTDIFDVNMANGDSHALSYTTTQFFAVDDHIWLTVTHVLASGTPSSTVTGTIVFTLIP
jgi:hypothetical protein